MKVTESELRDMQKRVSGGVEGHARLLQRAAPKSVSNPARSPYKSKLENAYAGYLHGLKLAGDILLYRYEPIRLKLSEDISYCPDFWVRFKDGREEYHECKGHTKSLMQRAGMLKVKLAAAHWPFWKFVIVTRTRGQWEQKPLRYEHQVLL